MDGGRVSVVIRRCTGQEHSDAAETSGSCIQIKGFFRCCRADRRAEREMGTMMLRKAFGVVAAAVLAGAITVGVPSPAAAGVTPQCTTRWNVLPAGAGGDIWMPYAEAAESDVCFMHRGSYSWGVWALQKALSVCYGKAIAADLSFGPKTEQALREVQSSIGANPDGGYGPETRGLLRFVSVASPDDPSYCHTRY